jgi:hypothetical protein
MHDLSQHVTSSAWTDRRISSLAQVDHVSRARLSHSTDTLGRGIVILRPETLKFHEGGNVIRLTLHSLVRGMTLALLGVVLSAGCLAAREAQGHRFEHRLADLPTIPAEWAGIWSTVDSTFSCTGELLSVETYMDTLCVGVSVGYDDEVPVNSITCSGSVDATSASFGCDGSEPAGECTATFSTSTVATRNGDTYTGTSTTSLEFSGTGVTCDFIPGFCEETRSTGTRVASAPEDCSVAVTDVPWTTLKQIYR